MPPFGRGCPHLGEDAPIWERMPLGACRRAAVGNEDVAAPPPLRLLWDVVPPSVGERRPSSLLSSGRSSGRRCPYYL